MALLPLRLFLGGTFVYAGVQKLSDPGFLHAGAPTYIGTQLKALPPGTPGGFLLRTFALPHPELAGVGVAIAEIVIGLLVTARASTPVSQPPAGWASTCSSSSPPAGTRRPYFLGPDIVFCSPGCRLVLAGAEGQPALDNVDWTPSPAIARRTQPPASGGAADCRGSGAVDPPRRCWREFAGAALADRRDLGACSRAPTRPPAASALGGSGAAGQPSAPSRPRVAGGGAAEQARLRRRSGPSRSPGRRQARPRQPTSDGPGRDLQRPDRRLARHPDPRRPTAASRRSAPSAPMPAARSATKAASSSAPATAASTAPKPAK